MARIRIRPAGSFEERCAAQAKLKLEKAAMLPLGAERAQLEREAWELQNATAMNEMLAISDAKPSA